MKADGCAPFLHIYRAQCPHLASRRLASRTNKTKQADPDLLRNELPENGGYIQKDPLRAGMQTHREAGWVSLSV